MPYHYYKWMPDDTLVGVDDQDYLEALRTKRKVGNDHIGNIHVSTVFLATNENYYGEGPPILFETRILGDDQDGQFERYCTAQEAREGHARWVNFLTPPVPISPTPLFGGKRRIKWK